MSAKVHSIKRWDWHCKECHEISLETFNDRESAQAEADWHNNKHHQEDK